MKIKKIVIIILGLFVIAIFCYKSNYFNRTTESIGTFSILLSKEYILKDTNAIMKEEKIKAEKQIANNKKKKDIIESKSKESTKRTSEISSATSTMEKEKKVITKKKQEKVSKKKKRKNTTKNEKKERRKNDIKYWCVEGGSHHIAGDGKNEHGYFSTWEKAHKAFQKYTKGWASVQYKISQCSCGLYYFWAIQ